MPRSRGKPCFHVASTFPSGAPWKLRSRLDAAEVRGTKITFPFVGRVPRGDRGFGARGWSSEGKPVSHTIGGEGEDERDSKVVQQQGAGGRSGTVQQCTLKTTSFTTGVDCSVNHCTD